MANQVVHYEIRAKDADSARAFYGKLFGWTFPPGAEPGYTYVETGEKPGIPGGIGRAQAGNGHVTFFVGVDDVAAALANATRLGGTVVLPATHVTGVTFGLFADPEGHVIGVSKND